jgi:hypothetical protein
MRKEYDLRSLKVKRRGVLPGLQEGLSQAPARKKSGRSPGSPAAAKAVKRAARPAR